MARHADLIAALRRAVFEGAGVLAPALRQAVARNEGVPEDLRAYVGKVAACAYQVTDADVAALKSAGYSDDQLFEITVSAAVGAGLSRLEAGLQALRGKT